MVVQPNGKFQRMRPLSLNDVSNVRKNPYTTRSPWNKSDSDCYEIVEEINEISKNSIRSIDSISPSQLKRQKFSQQRRSLESSSFFNTPSSFVASSDYRPLVPTRSVSGDKLITLQQCQDSDRKKTLGMSYSSHNVQTLQGYKVPAIIIHDVELKNRLHRRSMTESNLSYYGYNSPDSKPIMPTRSVDRMNEIRMVNTDTFEDTDVVVDSYVKPTQRRRSVTESSLVRYTTAGESLDLKPVKPTRSFDEMGHMSSRIHEEEENMMNEEWNMPNQCQNFHSQYQYDQDYKVIISKEADCYHSSINNDNISNIQHSNKNDESSYALVSQEFHCDDHEEISNKTELLFEAMSTNHHQKPNNMEGPSSSKKAKLHDDINNIISTNQPPNNNSMKRFNRRCSLDSSTANLKRECIVTNQSICRLRRLSLEHCTNLKHDCIITKHQSSKSMKRLICRRRSSLESSCQLDYYHHHHQTTNECDDSIHNNNKKKRSLWSRSLFHRLTSIKM